MKKIILKINKLLDIMFPSEELDFVKRFYSQSCALDLGDEFPLEDAVALASLASLKIQKNSKVLEIGSWKGRSSVVLGSICKARNANLTCIDTWKGSFGVVHHEMETKAGDVYEIFLKNIAHSNLQDSVKSMRIDSKEFFKIKSEKFDLIFFDGDHRFTPFKIDVESATHHLNKKGLLCGHDCEFAYDSLPQKHREEIAHHLEEDFIQVGENEEKHGLHPGVIFGLKSIFGEKAHTIRSKKRAGNGVWFVPESETHKKIVEKTFIKNLEKAEELLSKEK